jgi:hypothetical protein
VRWTVANATSFGWCDAYLLPSPAATVRRSYAQRSATLRNPAYLATGCSSNLLEGDFREVQGDYAACYFSGRTTITGQ